MIRAFFTAAAGKALGQICCAPAWKGYAENMAWTKTAMLCAQTFSYRLNGMGKCG